MSNEFYELFDGKDVTVIGPFWSAQVVVVKLQDPHDNGAKDSLGLRSLFVTRRDLNLEGAGNKTLLLPGTMLALCHVKSLDIKLNREGEQPSLSWENADKKPPEGDIRVKSVEEFHGMHR